MNILNNYKVTKGKNVKIKDYSTVPPLNIDKEKIVRKTQNNLEKMGYYQDRLYSEGKEGIVFVFQAMDAAGKDSTIKNVMSGLNPQGIDVYSFKTPSSEELAHAYFWRAASKFPSRGKIAIFNRSYYEDVLVVKVHNLHKDAKLPQRCKHSNFFETRYKEITDFEQYAYNNGYRIVKFFLNVSKDEQKKRFLERIDLKIKNWKFSTADVKERQFWNKYMKAYEDAISNTTTENSPWYIVPADKKWYTRYIVSEAILDVFEKIDPQYPTLPINEQQRLQDDKQLLLSE